MPEKIRKSRRSAVGSAQRSGVNRRSRRQNFRKRRKPLKTLTFSAFQFFKKPVKNWSDHMFDHLRKNEYFPLSRRSAAGSASRSGREGRGFKSRRLDHFNHENRPKL